MAEASTLAHTRTTSERIFDRFLVACRDRPAATAIVHPGGAWTYAQLDRASRGFAAQLLADVAKDEVVALYARRSGELVVGMLACLRAGITFAVLDAAYPAERLAQLLDVLRPGGLVSIAGTREDDRVLEQLALPRAVLRLDGPAIESLLRDDAVDDDRLDRVGADAIAYLLFTSGTTGTPKCIATSHAPLVHFIDWYETTFAAHASCRFSMLSGLAHDPILRDVFVPLSVGAELHVPPQAWLLDPAKLHAWMAQASVTHAHVTPQLCRVLCSGGRDRAPLPALRFVFSGGDSLRSRQAGELIAAAPSVRVVNFYGATETPQAMGYHVFDPGRDDATEIVPVGRGISDVQLLVLDERLQPTAIGTRGQIAIRTRYLSEGYRGDPDLTRTRFVVDPSTQERLYLTGDLGRVRPDGEVVIEGRLDDQVKIRGYRVELGEVVQLLEQTAPVSEAVVLPEALPDGENRLVAYLVARNGAATDAAATAAVRAAMAARSPAYMLPARYVWLPRFPLLPNGKIDRGALEVIEDHVSPTRPLETVEAQIAAEWQLLLGLPAIDVESSFVDLGGDSLSFIEASTHLEMVLGALPEGWEKLSIRELARHKRDKRSRWTRVDSSVLLRALSIVAVVAGHFELPNLAGSVLALFVVSGMSLGKYLVPQVLRTERVSSITRLILKIAVPTVIYTVMVNLAYHHPIWPGLLLVTNLVSPTAQVGGVGFWFIDVLLQSLLVLALLLALPPARRAIARDPFRFALGATAASIVVAIAAPHVWDTSQLYDRVPQQHVTELCLGWAVVHADTLRRRLVVVVATVVTFAMPAWQSEQLLVFPFVATFFLAFSRQVSMPLPVAKVVRLVAGASLFIYLIDHQVGLALTKVGLQDHAIAMTVIAVGVGVAAWQLISNVATRWTWLATFVPARRPALARSAIQIDAIP